MTREYGSGGPSGRQPHTSVDEAAIRRCIKRIDSIAATVVDPLQGWLDSDPCQPRLPARGLFVGLFLNAYLTNESTLTSTTEVLRSLPLRWRQQLAVQVGGDLIDVSHVTETWTSVLEGIAVLNPSAVDTSATDEDPVAWVTSQVLRLAAPEMRGHGKITDIGRRWEDS